MSGTYSARSPPFRRNERWDQPSPGPSNLYDLPAHYSRERQMEMDRRNMMAVDYEYPRWDEPQRPHSPPYNHYDHPTGTRPSFPLDQRRPLSPTRQGRSPPPYTSRTRSPPHRYNRSRSPIRRFRSPSPYGRPRATPRDMPLSPPLTSSYHDSIKSDLPPRPMNGVHRDRLAYLARSTPDGREKRWETANPSPRWERPGPGDGREKRWEVANPSPRWEQATPLGQRDRERETSPIKEGSKAKRAKEEVVDIPKDPEEVDQLYRYETWLKWFTFTHSDLAREEEAAWPNATTDDHPLVGIPKRYMQYKDDFRTRQLWSLYLINKDQAWFKDRYSPESEYANLRIESAKRGKIPAIEKYIKTLQTGEWDGVTYEGDTSIPDNTLPNGQRPSGPGKPQFEGSEIVEVPQSEQQLFVKLVHSDQSRLALEETLRHVPGYQYLAMSDPQPRKQYGRVGWIQFSEDTSMDNAWRTLNKIKIGEYTLNMVRNTETFVGRTRYTPPLSCALDRMRHDCVQAKAMAIKIEDDLAQSTGTSFPRMGYKVPTLKTKGSDSVSERIQIIWEKTGLAGADESLEEDAVYEKVRIELDQWLCYLRNALHTCYYCVAPTDYREELYRKCIRHLRTSPLAPFDQEAPSDAIPFAKSRTNRRHPDKTTRPDAWTEKRWSDNVDQKIKLLILPKDQIQIETLGGKQKEDHPEYRKIVLSKIIKDDPKKSHCTICNKPFKGPEFVVKHIVSRHPETVQELSDPKAFMETVAKDYPMFNNFIMDPQHLPPPLHFPASINEKAPALPAEMLPATEDLWAHRTSRNGDDMHDGGSINSRQRSAQSKPKRTSDAKPSRKSLDAKLSKQSLLDAKPLMDGLRKQVKAPVVKEDPRARKGKISYVDLDARPAAAPAESSTEGGLPW